MIFTSLKESACFLTFLHNEVVACLQIKTIPLVASLSQGTHMQLLVMHPPCLEANQNVSKLLFHPPVKTKQKTHMQQ